MLVLVSSVNSILCKIESSLRSKVSTTPLSKMLKAQTTTALDACLTGTHMRIEDLWPDARERVNIDKYARYLSEQDYYSWSHLRDLENYFKREPEERRAERLSRLLVIMLYNIGATHCDRVRALIEEWVMRPETYDRILGFEGLKGLALQPYICQKIILTLRRFMDEIHDGELALAIEEDFIKNIDAWFRRRRTAFYEEQQARMSVIRTDLMAAAWHPRRVEFWLNQGGFEMLEMMNGGW